jgi:glycosyltransferase involved in cell wall biosynthesis
MNVAAQPLVSIVTPVYNEEEHLAECVESILAQRYENWQCTIVNNCSTDRTLEIARGYAAKDARIRVHDNKRFLDIIPNHNLAIRQISPASKYCKVVLGDDWIFPRCLERMVAVAETNPSVGVVSAYQQYGDQIRITGLPLEQTLVSGREACRHFLLDRLLLFGSPTSVLYRADLVRSRNPFFLETDSFPDFEVCFALLRTSDLGFVHEVLTFSRPRFGSIASVSADLGTHYGSTLNRLFTYGPICLTSEEFEECLGRLLSDYYRFLGRRLFVERDPRFWSYHKETLAKAGLGFSRTRLAKAAARELCGFVLDPKSTLESVTRFFSLRKIRNWEKRRVVADAGATPSSGNKRVQDGNHSMGRS